jgi:hypothetical protein
VRERRCARGRSECFGEYVGVCRGCAGADEARFRGAQMGDAGDAGAAYASDVARVDAKRTLSMYAD